MGEIDIRVEGKAGRITLTRPEALNALTYDMALAIEQAVDGWRDDAAVALVVIDAEGDRAFCSGGDIAKLYETGRAGDFAWGQQFWRDEYRLNAKLARYPKPIAAFMQGFTMGGGVGISCHSSHRVVGDSSRIAMPENGIGLVPDVGGSLILANAPDRVGVFLGLTATRMNAADAIHVGFADHCVPEAVWPEVIAKLQQTGDTGAITDAAVEPAGATLPALAEQTARLFQGGSLAEIRLALEADASDFATDALKKMSRNSPLSMAVFVAMMQALAGREIEDALEMEYRYVSRSMEHGDFLEGIRAQIIDKDRNPTWQHVWPGDVPQADVDRMLATTEFSLPRD
ncbi:MAG: enoyl-CoA hydratase/isomerase family protein [Pseudomonadota bacterium]